MSSEDGGATLECAACGHQSASRGGADIHTAMAHVAGQPPPRPAAAAPLPLATPAGRPPTGAGQAVICLSFAVVLLLFLGGLVAADRGWVDKGPEVATIVAAAPDAPAAPVVPGDWRTVRDTAAGFSVALPDGWTDVPLDAGTMDRLLNEARRADPEFGASLDYQARQAAAAGGRLLAFETDRGGALNMTVMTSDSGGATLGDVQRDMTAELAALGVADISQERVTLPAGPAFRLTYDVRVGGIGVRQVVHMVIGGGDVFAVTVTTDEPERDGPTIDGIARSFAVFPIS